MAPARPQKLPMVLEYGSSADVILPSKVVPKSRERQGFRKSTSVHFDPSFVRRWRLPLSLATISTPVEPFGEKTRATGR